MKYPTLAALLTLCASLEPLRATEPIARPNIVWLVAEDASRHYVGAYGSKVARTPHFDRLATTGVLYRNAHSSAPICAPSRSTIITGAYASSLGTQAMRSARPLPAGVDFFPTLLRRSGYYCTNNAKTDYNTSTSYAAAWDESSPRAHWRNRAPGQPFFAVFNFQQSHESRLQVRQPLIADPAQVRVPAYLPDTPEIRATIAQYFDCVSRADEAAGRILRELEEDGLRDSTIIFYYADNGGSVTGTKRFLHDEGTHVPFMIHFPARWQSLAPAPAGSQLDELVNFVDLAPTVLSLVGLPAPAYFEGRALAGPARGGAPEFTFVFRDRMDERFDLSRAVTDGRYRYVRHYFPYLANGRPIGALWKQAASQEWERLYREGRLNPEQSAFFQPKPAEELFDCHSDPDNVVNLASDPAHRSRLERMRAALNAHLLRTRDTGFLPETMLAEICGAQSAVTITSRDETYPLARILELLDRLQLAKQPDANTAADAMHDPLPLIRYWGAVAGHRAFTAKELSTLLTDASPAVRLQAADLVLRARDSTDAWRVVQANLQSDTPAPLRLHAANIAADQQSTPPSVLTALAALTDLKETYFGSMANEVENYYARLAKTRARNAEPKLSRR